MSDDVISGLQRCTCTPDRYNYSSDIMMMSSRVTRSAGILSKGAKVKTG